MPSLGDLEQAYFQQGAASLQTRASMVSLEAGAITGPTLLKVGTVRVLAYNVYNPNSVPAFLQLFNAATTGAVTVGTTVPVKQLAIPTGGVLDGMWDFGPSFPLGLVAAATTTQMGSTLATTGLSVSLGTS